MTLILTPDTFADPLELLHGLPFLDDDFASGRLLAGVAAVRHAEAAAVEKGDDRAPQAWLWPAAVYMLRDSTPMPAQPLTRVRATAVHGRLRAIADAVPAWRALTQLPIRYALLEPAHGAVSASSRAWQQHILLADAAFASPSELREQIVHELSHQWLYLIQELWELERAGAPPLTLPSGTRGRSPAEVLGAAHVAVVLMRLYGVTGDEPSGRVAALSRYATGCLDLLTEHHLTDAGEAIARRLMEAL